MPRIERRETFAVLLDHPTEGRRLVLRDPVRMTDEACAKWYADKWRASGVPAQVFRVKLDLYCPDCGHAMWHHGSFAGYCAHCPCLGRDNP